MEFRILGPLEVLDGGGVLELGAPKQRALGAILLLHANEVVSTDRLIDELWGEHPPATAGHVLQVYVSQLRKVLDGGGRGVLVTRAPGYMIAVEPDQLDLHRFERLVTEAREARAAGEPATASAKLVEALGLWRGPPLDDFAFEPFAQGEIARLEELRVVALEDRIECDLALGRHTELAAELESLIRRYPLRERLRAHLMLALYRSGRQAEALAAYQDARRALVDELGIEPSPALQGLEQRILRQDADLEALSVFDEGEPPAAAAAAAVDSGPRGTMRRRTALLIGLAGLLVAAAVATTVALLGRGGASSEALSLLPANSVGRLDPGTNRIAGATTVGSGPTLIAAGEGAIWVANFDDKTLSRIDPATGEERRTIAAEGTPTGLAVGAGAVWVSHDFEGTLSRIDPGLNEIVATIALASGVNDVAVDERHVWVVNQRNGSVLRIDPGTNDVVSTIDVGDSPAGLAVGLGGVWVGDGRAVVRIDPETETLTRIALRYNATRLAVGDGAVWVSNNLGDSITRIDPRTDAAVAYPVGDGPVGIAVDAGAVWVAESLDGTVSRIDPETGAVDARIEVGSNPTGIVVHDRVVWVTAPAP